MATKGEKATLLIGSGIVGFLIGYFLRKPRAAPTGVILEQLQITPASAYPGDTITISCIATNYGVGDTFTIVAQAGNTVLEQDVFLEPEIPTEVVFLHTVPQLTSGRATGNMVGVPYYVTVSVGDLIDSFRVISPPVESPV